jgi:outer membrane protein
MVLMWRLILFLMPAWAAGAEHSMRLREAVDQALAQNPDLVLARLDQRFAEERVRVARDPFSPRIAAGSGLAYNNGFPLSIEGAAPSVFQASANQFLYNRPQSYLVAKAREEARGAAFQAASRQDEVVFRVASLFVDAERARKELALARKQVDSLERIAAVVAERVAAGRELEIENKRARLNLARARQRVRMLESDALASELSLAAAIGLEDGDRVVPAEEIRDPAPLPESETAAVDLALGANNDLRKLDSDLAAEGLAIRAEKAANLPRVDLVARYGLFARFNNYADFYRTFVRNNGLVGLSFQIPLLTGPASSALAAQAQINAAKLRVRRGALRNQIALDVRKSWREVQEAESALEVANFDLEVAREQVSVLLAQHAEGRATLRQIEEARFAENEKWIGFLEANYALERARLALLRHTGELQARIR